MRFKTTTPTGKTKEKRGWFLHAFRLLAAALLLLSTVAASAERHGKIAADFSKFPVNSDGTVDVIIQFKQKPTGRHFTDMAWHGGRLKRSLYQISGASYRIPVRMLLWLERHPDVAYVSPDRPNTPAFDDEIPAVMGDLARQQYGMDGTGVGVAVIDSGVFNHPDLQSADGTTSRIVYSESFVPGDPSTNDAYGHGTHVAGIIAGNGRSSQSGYYRQYIGLAPNANIINLRVLGATGAGSDSQVIAAIQRAIELKDTYNIRVINLSLGRNVFESYAIDPLCQAVEQAWQAGIVVVVAAGNHGRDNSAGTDGYSTIQVPGNDPSVITVGATKTNGTDTRLDDTVASFSSKGPSAIDHVVKPDLVAPGNRIVSLESPGSYLATTFSTLQVAPPPTCDALGICSIGPGGDYLRMSGTSMATPVVAAAAALMVQSDPSLTPDVVKARMLKTAWKGHPTISWAIAFNGFSFLSHYDLFTIGAGYLDIDAALGSVDTTQGSAASPIAVYDPLTGRARLANSPPLVAGSSIVWEDLPIWGSSIVWGNGVMADSIIWDGGAVWSDPSLTGTSIVWSESIIWEDSLLDALSVGEDGEN